MKRMILSAIMVVAAMTFSINANAQTEKKEIKKEQKAGIMKARKAAKKSDFKKVDATTAATSKAAGMEKKDCCKEKMQAAEGAKKCDGCKKGEGKCDKAKAAGMEKKDCCKEKMQAAEGAKKCDGCKKGEGKCDKAKAAETEKKD